MNLPRNVVATTALGALILIGGCSREIDPAGYFNADRDGKDLEACMAQLSAMVPDIKRKKLDDGEYRPGSELSIKNVTYRYYQGLVSEYERLPQYRNWRLLTRDEKLRLGMYTGCPELRDFTTHEAAIKREVAEIERQTNTKLPYESLEEVKEGGRKALERADDAIRIDADSRRKRLEAAAVGHTMTNRAGVRIDTYQLKNGRAVVCSTTVPSAGAPDFDCDGQP